MKRTPMRSRVKASGPPAAVVEIVYERAQHSCEYGGCMIGDRRGVDHHLHHRRPRRSGGDRRPDTNTPPNLVLLCPAHHEHIESHRVDAYRSGFLLHANAVPSREPVLICGRWALLTASGYLWIASPPGREVV